MMRIRDLRAGELKDLQEKSKMAYDKHSFPAVIDDVFVLEDESGTARAVFLTERVAEVFMVIDHEWENPATRWEMVRAGANEVRRRLLSKGYRTAYAFFGDGVKDGYIKRLVRGFGAVVQKRFVRFVGD